MTWADSAEASPGCRKAAPKPSAVRAMRALRPCLTRLMTGLLVERAYPSRGVGLESRHLRGLDKGPLELRVGRTFPPSCSLAFIVLHVPCRTGTLAICRICSVALVLGRSRWLAGDQLREGRDRRRR